MGRGQLSLRTDPHPSWKLEAQSLFEKGSGDKVTVFQGLQQRGRWPGHSPNPVCWPCFLSVPVPGLNTLTPTLDLGSDLTPPFHPLPDSDPEHLQCLT